MDNFLQARANMVESQVHTNDVTDHRLLAALHAIPREKFVPSQLRAIAYIDEDLPLDGIEGVSNRYLMEPMPFARLVQLADIQPDDLVLDIGCATGYSAAVLARLASSVVALEQNEHLANLANENLPLVDAGNAAVVTGDLAAGYPSEGPYDVIIVNGAVDDIPQTLCNQLKDGGRLVAVVNSNGIGKATLMKRAGETVSSRYAFDAAVKSLPGFEKKPSFVF